MPAPDGDRPFLGVGLGIDVHSAEPDWRRLLREGWKDPARPRFDYFEVYTRGEAGAAAAVAKAVAGRFPLLYHHEGLEAAYPGGAGAGAVRAAAENMRSLGALWCVEELAYRQVDGRYLDFFMPAVLTRASLDATVENVRRLQGDLPGPLVPENPPYAFALGPLHVLEFMGELAERADCSLVLDLGHLYSYQLCAGLDPLARLDALDLSRVVEVHLAGAEVLERGGVPIYQDLHGAGEILDEPLRMLDAIAPHLANLRAVTIEVEDAPVRRALAQAKRVRAIPAIRERQGACR